MKLLRFIIPVVILVMILSTILVYGTVSAAEPCTTDPVALYVDVPVTGGSASYPILIKSSLDYTTTFYVEWWDYISVANPAPKEWISSIIPNRFELPSKGQGMTNVAFTIPEDAQDGSYSMYLGVKTDPAQPDVDGIPIAVTFRIGSAIPTSQFTVYPSWMDISITGKGDAEKEIQIRVTNKGSAESEYVLLPFMSIPGTNNKKVYEYTVNGEIKTTDDPAKIPEGIDYRLLYEYQPITNYEQSDTAQDYNKLIQVPTGKEESGVYIYDPTGESSVYLRTSVPGITDGKPGVGILYFKLFIPESFPNGYYEARVECKMAEPSGLVSKSYQTRLFITVNRDSGSVGDKEGSNIPVIGGSIAGLALVGVTIAWRIRSKKLASNPKRNSIRKTTPRK